MSTDQTQHQSDDELRRAQELSLTRSRPPADVPGYEPQKFLGSGAYGEVWVAIDQNTGRRVAIKFYTHRGGLDWSLLSREVEKLVLLSADRYVVQLLDVGWESEPPHYVMEYIENGSLEELLRDQGPLPVDEAVGLFREVAVGLMHAHAKGVLHCDLKPANVLLDQDEKPRLADFGQSRLSHEQTPALGTLFYMAPEQADLEAVPDACWDVYALGALLYCMLTGAPPYRSEKALTEIDSAEDLEERLARYRKAIRAAPSPAAHRRLPGVDRALAEIVERCLAIEPGDRYANVQGVLDALEARDEARARRPLVTLGFVGPALLLLIMVLFGWRGYTNAVGASDRGVTIKGFESNQFAAEFVAGTVAHQIDRYFRATEDVAADVEFQELFARTIEDEEFCELLQALGDPNADEDTLEAIRAKYVRHPIRQQLQERLEAVLVDPEYPKAASWFVTNNRGRHVAAAFHSPPTQSPVGRYFGWRTYFTGLPADLEKTAVPDTHITETHLSAVFQSTATHTWKVAISTPITRGGQFQGVLAITAEIGGFMEFEGSDTRFADTRFPVLVGGREGQNRGAILQHPLFEKLLSQNDSKVLPARFGRYHVDLDKHFGDGRKPVTEYEDPLGKDEEGGQYNKRWIAARRDVRLVRGVDDEGNPRSIDTGLVVLVQEDYEAAVEPVHRLGPQLVRLGLVALGAMVAVVTLQWYFVVRLLSQRRGGAPHRTVRRAGATPLHSMTTIAAPHRTNNKKPKTGE